MISSAESTSERDAPVSSANAHGPLPSIVTGTSASTCLPCLITLSSTSTWPWGTDALAPPPQGQDPGGSQTGICLDTTDVDADHAALKAAGADVDEEVSRWGGPVPPMFWLRDPDGNSLIVVQPSE